MKGIALSEKYYREYGVPMLKEKFPHLEGILAIGLVGSGSECFGYDDVTSQDHDFEPGFCIFLPGEDLIDAKTEFALERAYAKLPKEYLGYQRPLLNPVGGNRHGVIRIDSFFLSKTGTTDGKLSLHDWFHLPEQSLAEATNGKVFRDDLGHFSAIRERLSYFPEDVRRKKLAGHLLLMGQSGQYNYPRCLMRGDTAAAQLAVIEFVKSALHTVFLLNKRYIPYYKWTFRALSDLPLLSSLYEVLEQLISSPNTQEEVERKQRMIEEICSEIVKELINQNLSESAGNETESHAYAVNNKITDSQIRNLHILYAV